ncbi:MAG: hypothetical protein QF473_10540 [Planctomycetota bacterium]|jgi:hypothetical protein|nr:hypothetical protein [Planctomycetota bacterium]
MEDKETQQVKFDEKKQSADVVIFFLLGAFVLSIISVSYRGFWCRRCGDHRAVRSMNDIRLFFSLSYQGASNTAPAYCSEHGHVWSVFESSSETLHDWEENQSPESTSDKPREKRIDGY